MKITDGVSNVNNNNFCKQALKEKSIIVSLQVVGATNSSFIKTVIPKSRSQVFQRPFLSERASFLTAKNPNQVAGRLGSTQ